MAEVLELVLMMVVSAAEELEVLVELVAVSAAGSARYSSNLEEVQLQCPYRHLRGRRYDPEPGSRSHSGSGPSPPLPRIQAEVRGSWSGLGSPPGHPRG